MEPSLSLVGSYLPAATRRYALAQHGYRPATAADLAEAACGIKDAGGVGGLDAEGDGGDPAIRPGLDHGLQQYRADAAASPFPHDGDRQLRYVRRDEAVAGIVGCKATEPRGADRLAADSAMTPTSSGLPHPSR